MDIIHGPTAQLIVGNLIYQVTLASGMIVTNPSAFARDEYTLTIPKAVVSEGGQILSAPKNFDDRERHVKER